VGDRRGPAAAEVRGPASGHGLGAEPEPPKAAGSGRESLAVLYARHGPDAVRLAALLTGDPVLAQDLVQEAFVRLGGRLVHLRRPEAFEAYLRRTVVNLARMHFRRRRVERAWLARQAHPEREAASTSPGVEDRDALRTALGRLPERQRSALVLRFYGDLTHDQIAQALGCRPGTAASLVSRGLARLRDDLEGSVTGK
jgi:RNA polymerase sigma-70 factor (sigma-E family)